jgi:hypothetical protein
MVESTRELRWRRAERCNSANCVEVAQAGDHVLVRDSKNLHISPIAFTRDEWRVFVAGARAGDFDFG